MQVVGIKKVVREPVYDITVQDAGHYILENGTITHNSGLEYAASTISFLSKKKERDEKTKKVTGAIITAVINKGRLTVEQTKVETLLDFATGLDRYYGLCDLALDFGVFKKNGNYVELPDGSKAYQSQIEDNPEKYWTKDILEVVDEKCKENFKYGGHKKAEAAEVVDAPVKVKKKKEDV